MSLQDWFYAIGIAFMTSWFLLILAVIIMLLWAADQIKKAKVEAELRTMELRMALKNMTKPGIVTSLSLIPVIWRMARKWFK